MPKVTAKTRYKPELIELLLTEPINLDNSNTNSFISADRNNPVGFAEKFSLFLDETPNIGSTSDSEFFIHGILGSILTLPNSGLVEKLGINKIYVKHVSGPVQYARGHKKARSEVHVVKLCFVLKKDEEKRVALRVFTIDEISDQFFNNDELKEIAEKVTDICSIDEHLFRISVDRVDKSFILNQQEKSRTKEDLTKAVDSSQAEEFKEISMAQSPNLEDSFKKLSDKDIKEIMGGTEEIFKQFASVYQDNQKELSLFNSEAAYHGFHYGALALNFKYRHGLNCYVERVAGSGRVDLIFMSRTEDANGRMNPKPIPVVVEFKGEGHTADKAIAQIKDKGYLYNLSIRTKAEKAVIVGTAKGGGLKVEEGDIFQSRGFIYQLLEEIDEDDISEMQKSLKSELKNLYHSIHSHEQHYLSKLVLGQILATELSDKHIFHYEDTEIGEEVATFALNQEDLPVILNIIEHTGRKPTYYPALRGSKNQRDAFDSNKVPLIDDKDVIKIDITIISEADEFESGGSKKKFYCQSIDIDRISSSEDKGKDKCEKKDEDKGKYKGKFKEIETVDISNLIKKLQNADMNDDDNVTESLSSLAEALLPLKEKVKGESDFQAIMQGLFINGKTEDGKEIRVYTESNLSPRGRIDLALSFTHVQGGEFLEDEPIIVELKKAATKSIAKKKLTGAKEQLKEKYDILRSFTSKKTAKHLAMVFNIAAQDKEELLLASMSSVKVCHTSSDESQNHDFSSESDCLYSDRRKKRSANCLFSWDDIDKFNNAEDAYKRDINKIEIDVKRLVSYILDNNNARKNAQLVQFAEEIFERNSPHSDEQDSVEEAEDSKSIGTQSPSIAVLFGIVVVGGYFDLFKMILDDESRKDDYLNARDNNGKTLLHLAAQYGRLEVVKYLVEQCADINAKDMDGRTPFEIAFEQNKTEVIKFLAIAKDKNGNTALHYAAKEGKFNLVGLLLDNNADINAKNKDDSTPLLLVAVEGYLSIATLLVNRGANINAKDKYGRTPFEVALEYNKTDVVKFLATTKDKYNSTALHYAVSDNNLDLVMLLTQKGANINSKNDSNKTPLDIARELGHTDVEIYLALLQTNDIAILISRDTAVQSGDDDSSGKDLETRNSSSESDYLSSSVRKRRSTDSSLLWVNKLSNLEYANSREMSEVRSEYEGLISYIQDNKDKREISWLAKRTQDLFEKYSPFLDKQDLEECSEDEDEDEDKKKRPRNKSSNNNLPSPDITALLIFGSIIAGFLGLFKKLFDSIEELNICIDVRDNSGKTFLHLAAQHGRLEVVEYLVEQCADINAKDGGGKTPFEIALEYNQAEVIKFLAIAKDKDGNTALHYAIEDGNLNLIRLLIENGADINAKDMDGRTPFEIAFEQNKTEVIKFLAIAKDKNGNTALHYAAKEDKFNLVGLLLDNNADINAKNKDGNTPLLLVAEKGYLNIMRLLVNRGAGINVKDKNNKTSFEIALEHDKTEVVKFLAIAKDKDGNTALHYAIEDGNLNLVRLLIENGADINAKNKDGMTPFEIALEYNKTEVVNFLATAKDKENNTVLHYAFEENKSSIVFPLLRRGADIEAKNKDGNTPLLLAAKRGSLGIVRSVAGSDFRPDISAKDKNGNTALKIALEYNQTDMADLLQVMQDNYNKRLFSATRGRDLNEATYFLNRGAEVNATDESGFTSLYVAALHHPCLDIVKLLIRNGADVNAEDSSGRTLLHWVIDESIAKLLIEEGADINAKDNRGQTPLHTAICSARLRAARFFINSDADIEAKDNDGRTTLHLAVECCCLDIVELLIRKDADINAKDNRGQTPLHYAIKFSNPDVVKSLIDGGADISNRDDFGRMPLHYAAEKGSLRVAKLLIENGADISAEDDDNNMPLDLAHPDSEVKSFLREKQNERLIQRERRHHHGDHSRHHSGEQKYLQGKERSVHLKLKGTSHSIGNDDSAIENNQATSGASKPSSWVNEGISRVKELPTNTYLATKGVVVELLGSVNRLVGSICDRILVVEEAATVNEKTIKANEETTKYKLEFRKDIPNSTSNTPHNSADQANGDGQKQGGKHAYNYFTSEDFSKDNVNYIDANLKRAYERQMPGAFKLDGKETTAETIFKMGEHYLSQVDNGMITFLDFLIRRITGQKHISTQVKDISEQEARTYAFEITQECKKIVEQAASKSGISMHRLNIDFMEIRKEITRKITSDKFNEIPGTLNSYVEKACPSKETGCPGKLSLKKFDKFMAEFNKGLDVTLSQLMQQVLSRNSTLKTSNVKEQQISLEPRSYLNNTFVQGHLTQDRDLKNQDKVLIP